MKNGKANANEINSRIKKITKLYDTLNNGFKRKNKTLKIIKIMVFNTAFKPTLEKNGCERKLDLKNKPYILRKAKMV